MEQKKIVIPEFRLSKQYRSNTKIAYAIKETTMKAETVKTLIQNWHEDWNTTYFNPKHTSDYRRFYKTLPMAFFGGWLEDEEPSALILDCAFVKELFPLHGEFTRFQFRFKKPVLVFQQVQNIQIEPTDHLTIIPIELDVEEKHEHALFKFKEIIRKAHV